MDRRADAAAARRGELDADGGGGLSVALPINIFCSFLLFYRSWQHRPYSRGPSYFFLYTSTSLAHLFW